MTTVNPTHPPRADAVETEGWTAAASQLRIRLLLGREPAPALNRALAEEVRRLGVLLEVVTEAASTKSTR